MVDTQKFVKLKFLSLLVFLFSFHLIPAHLDIENLGLWLLIILTLIFIASTYQVTHSKVETYLAIVLAVASVAMVWFAFLKGGQFVANTSIILLITFFLYITFLIGRYIYETKVVGLNVILAAMCLYLMIGLLWTFIYYWIEVSQPGSFTNPPTFSGNKADTWLALNHFSYYSFVTLTTLGYGDIAPISRIAKSWVTVEAIIGQFYLAIVIARLVGSYAADAKK